MNKLRTSIATSVLLLATILFCYSLLASAEEQQFFQIDMENVYTDYNELNLRMEKNGQLKSHEYGYLPGIHAGYIYQNTDNSLDFRLNLSYDTGSYSYDGSLQNGTPHTGVSSASLFDVNFLAALYTFNTAETALYSGVGYHAWNRGVCAISNPPGFPENYSWGYVPVGIRSNLDVGTDFSIEPDFSARFMFAGKMGMPDYNGSVTLGNKYGFNFKIPILYTLDSDFRLVLTPWADYSTIGKSTDSLYANGGYWIEPDSCTWQFGANIGLRIKI